jgi:hypothetical protein
MSDYTELEVHHLGEDGDDWLVTGTTKETHDSDIHVAVAKEILDVIGINKEALETIEGLPELACLTFRPDWGYEPIDPQQPDDECYLVHGDKVPEGAEKFAGTRVFL